MSYSICRLCLSYIRETITVSNHQNPALEAQIKHVLPEIDVALSSELILCNQCLKLLNEAYIFKCECLRTESAIKDFLVKSACNVPFDLKYMKDLFYNSNKDTTEARTSDPDKVKIITKNEETEFDSVTNQCVDIKPEISDDVVNLTCDMCKQIFYDESIFHNHKTRCSTITQTNEDNLILVDNSRKERRAYLRLIQERKYICNVCNVRFANQSTLRRHADTHSDEKKYKCTSCDKSFKSKGCLDRHIRSNHEGNKRYTCDTCGKHFYWKYSLLEHIRIHTGEKPYKCETCGKGYAQHSTLMVHVNSMHKKEKPYACETCGKTFTLKGNLRTHMVVHQTNKERNHVCSHCNKGFVLRKHLYGHLQVHQDIKSHVCPICNKSLHSGTALKIHLRTHTGEKPFECDICQKGFSQRYNLKIHLKSHKPKVRNQ